MILAEMLEIALPVAVVLYTGVLKRRAELGHIFVPSYYLGPYKLGRHGSSGLQ